MGPRGTRDSQATVGPLPTTSSHLCSLAILFAEPGGRVRGRPTGPGEAPLRLPHLRGPGGPALGPPPWTFWPRCRPVGLREGAAWAEGMERSAWGDRRPARPEHPSVQMRLRDPKDPGTCRGHSPETSRTWALLRLGLYSWHSCSPPPHPVPHPCPLPWVLRARFPSSWGLRVPSPPARVSPRPPRARPPGPK